MWWRKARTDCANIKDGWRWLGRHGIGKEEDIDGGNYREQSSATPDGRKDFQPSIRTAVVVVWFGMRFVQLALSQFGKI